MLSYVRGAEQALSFIWDTNPGTIEARPLKDVLLERRAVCTNLLKQRATIADANSDHVQSERHPAIVELESSVHIQRHPFKWENEPLVDFLNMLREKYRSKRDYASTIYIQESLLTCIKARGIGFYGEEPMMLRGLYRSFVDRVARREQLFEEVALCTVLWRAFQTDIWRLYGEMFVDITAKLGARAQLIIGRQAVLLNKPRIINNLLSCGLNIESPDADGVTLLMFAAERANVPMLQCLIRNGANARAMDVFHVSALHYAVEGQRELNLAFLLNTPALELIDQKIVHGETALNHAETRGRVKLAQILRNAGAKA